MKAYQLFYPIRFTCNSQITIIQQRWNTLTIQSKCKMILTSESECRESAETIEVQIMICCCCLSLDFEDDQDSTPIQYNNGECSHTGNQRFNTVPIYILHLLYDETMEVVVFHLS